VVPAHSFKFAATLQHAKTRELSFINPLIDTKAGHGAGKPIAKVIDAQADMWCLCNCTTLVENLNSDRQTKALRTQNKQIFCDIT
jgi:prolyl oligopeptidase